MPHISSQIHYDEPNRRATAPTLQRSPEFHDFQRPAQGRRPRKMSNAEDFPSLSLLNTSNGNKQWDIGSIRHIRQTSCNSDLTPDSAVESIFDAYSAGPYESPSTPNSSSHSSFVAELEDTSPAPIKVSKTKASVLKDPVVTQLESYIEKLQRPEFSVCSLLICQ